MYMQAVPEADDAQRAQRPQRARSALNLSATESGQYGTSLGVTNSGDEAGGDDGADMEEEVVGACPFRVSSVPLLD